MMNRSAPDQNPKKVRAAQEKEAPLPETEQKVLADANGEGSQVSNAPEKSTNGNSLVGSTGFQSALLSEGRDTMGLGQQGGLQSPAALTGTSGVAAPAAVQIGQHAFDFLDDVDLPQYVKAHNATLTFPEKLMLMLIHVERVFTKSGRKLEDAPIAWILNGRGFVIRDSDTLVRDWCPLFFRQGKFQSFTRKLYRWGFRQINMPREIVQNDYRELVFGNENFQRDNKSLLPRMRSVTAAGTRRQQASEEKQQGDSASDPGIGSSNVFSSAILESLRADHQRTTSLPSFSTINGLNLLQQHGLAQTSALPMGNSGPRETIDALNQMMLMRQSEPLIQRAIANLQLQQQAASMNPMQLMPQDAAMTQQLLSLHNPALTASAPLPPPFAPLHPSAPVASPVAHAAGPAGSADDERVRAVMNLLMQNAPKLPPSDPSPAP